jgi:hypothetical protein
LLGRKVNYELLSIDGQLDDLPTKTLNLPEFLLSAQSRLDFGDQKRTVGEPPWPGKFKFKKFNV